MDTRFEGALVDALNDAVVVASLDGVIVHVNAAAEAMFGWAGGALQGCSLSSLVPERLREAHEEGIARFAAGSPPRIIGKPIRLPALRADGSEIQIELLLSRVRSGAGDFIVGTLRDVGERVDLERETALVHQVLTMITDPDDAASPDNSTMRMLAGVGAELECDIAALWMVDSDARLIRPALIWQSPATATSALVEQTRQLTFTRGRGLPGRVWSSGEPVWAEDLSAEADFPRREAAAADGLGSGFAFPLTASGGLVGVIEMFRKQRGPAEPILLAAFGQLTAKLGTWLWRARLERENRELAEREHSVADALRMSLLPPTLPKIDGLELAADFQPAGDIIVGGDFYDAFVVPGGNGATVAIAIGDVCGNGPAAAATTAQVRYTLRALVQADVAPSDVLERVNDALLRREESDPRFCTAILGVITQVPDSTRVALSCAGHPAPIIYRHGGQIDIVESRGSLLGLLPNGSWSTVQVNLDPGDCLLMYTDGVTEAHVPGGDQFGEARLADIVGRLGAGDPGNMISRIAAAALEFGGGASDDIALFAVQCTRPNGIAPTTAESSSADR